MVWQAADGAANSHFGDICSIVVADQAVKHRVDNHEEQDPDHGGARLARGGPFRW